MATRETTPWDVANNRPVPARAPYGYCPKCGAPGHSRERRPNGDDTCAKGHKYPSATALKEKTTPFKPKTRTEEVIGEGYPETRPIPVEAFRAFVKHGSFTESERDSRLLAAMGIAGEAGEVCDLFKKDIFHAERTMDRQDLIKELGDVFWYLCMILNNESIDLETVMRANIYKLCDRYPDRYGKPEEWL